MVLLAAVRQRMGWSVQELPRPGGTERPLDRGPPVDWGPAR